MQIAAYRHDVVLSSLPTYREIVNATAIIFRKLDALVLHDANRKQLHRFVLIFAAAFNELTELTVRWLHPIRLSLFSSLRVVF